MPEKRIATLLLTAGANFLNFGPEVVAGEMAMDHSSEVHIELDASSYALGEQITIKVRNEDALVGSGIVLLLQAEMSGANRHKNAEYKPGCQGALTPITIPFVPGQTNTFYWNGLFTWWAPVDVPEPCKTTLAGSYFLRAYFYREAGAPIIGRLANLPINIRQSAKSQPFDLN